MLSLEFSLRFIILNVACFILLRILYFSTSPNRETVFSFFLFSNCVYLVTYLLGGINLSMGFAFGLFAVFAMLRYRTEAISMRDMTFMFVVIGMALISAVSDLAYLELIGVQAIIVCLAFLGEHALVPNVVEHKINYDKVELTRSENAEQLRLDLEERLGAQVKKIKVEKLDFISDSAQLVVYCSREKS